MPAARDYLDLDAGGARGQWRTVIARPPALEGHRQVDFLPVETLMCLAASLVVNHRHYGGSTSHLAESPVPELARLFQRPNSSVLAKMANLDGSRSNGARHEVEVAGALLGQPGKLARVYGLLLGAARAEGISPDELPDFLDLEGDGRELELLGQDELTEDDVEQVVHEAAPEWAARRSDLDPIDTEKLLTASVRIGQHRFAAEVLRSHDHRCVFCGLTIRLKGERARRMLVASHIKPWRDSTPTQRLDARNGLAACPTHDVAFDTGLLTVTEDLRIHVLPEVERFAAVDDATRAVFGRPPLAERLLLPPGSPPPKSEYLAWHRERIFGQSEPVLIPRQPTQA